MIFVVLQNLMEDLKKPWLMAGRHKTGIDLVLLIQAQKLCLDLLNITVYHIKSEERILRLKSLVNQWTKPLDMRRHHIWHK